MSNEIVRHGFAPVRLGGDPEESGPRIFVELWHTKDWPDVIAHLAKLSGVSDTTFREASGDEPALRFEFEGHAFAFYRGGGEYIGQVADAACPDEILLRVAHHFNRLLCPVSTTKTITSLHLFIDWPPWVRRLLGRFL